MTYWFMSIVGPGEAGREATRDDLLQTIKAIRKEPDGLTSATIAKHPLLLGALQAASPDEGADRLRDLAIELGDAPSSRAVRGSLAIEFSAGKGAHDRLHQMIAQRTGAKPYLSVTDRQAARLMNTGAEALADAIWRLTHHKVADEPSPKADGVMATPQDFASDTLEGTTPAPRESYRSTRSGRRPWLVGSVVTVIAVIAGMASYLVVSTKKEQTASGPDPVLMARYDGHDPRGIDGGPRCADPPPSQPVQGASRPDVYGPGGAIVGNIQLRRTPSCPVIWARVLWQGSETGSYIVPQGWTLHVIIHRPVTETSNDATEPSHPTPIPYALSMMLTTQPGCVYVEAYFTKGDIKTTTATTSCTIG